MAILLAAVLFVIIKPLGLIPKKVEVKPVTNKVAAGRGEITEQPVYDIDKIRSGGRKLTETELKDLADVYANYPAEDVGDNIITGWSKVDPKDKEKMIDGINKQIEAHRETLQRNPDDKRARNLLKISESIKNMALNNFNYKLEKQAPK